MPAMNTRHWRRAGFIPAGDAARAMSMTLVGLHRAMDVGRVPYERQGVYRFLKYTDLCTFVRSYVTDEEVQNSMIARLREARKLKNDRGSKRTK